MGIKLDKQVYTYYVNLTFSFIFLLICTTLLSGCTTKYNVDSTDVTESQTNFQYEYNAKQAQLSTKMRSAYSENGYYYLMNGILWFYDVGNDIATPVCSNGDCTHNTDKCNAYFLDKYDYDPYDLRGINVKGLGNQLWYIDGYIYIIERDEKGDYLVQYDSTFFNGKRICKITEDGEVLGMPSKNTEGTFAIYDKYLYYFSVKPVYANELVDNDYHTTVYCKRIAIDGKSSPEQLGTFEIAIDYDFYGSLQGGKVCVGENNVFFVAGFTNRFSSKKNLCEYKIYTYDAETHDFTMTIDIESDKNIDILGKAIGVKEDICAASKDSLFIVGNDGKAIYRVNKGEIKRIYNNSACKSIYSIVADGDYIYFMESYSGYVSLVKIDTEGNKLSERGFNCDGSEEAKGIYIYGVDQYNMLLGVDRFYVKDFVDKNAKPFTTPYIRTYSVLCMEMTEKLDGNIKIISKY